MWMYCSVVLRFVKGKLREREQEMLKMIPSTKFKQLNNDAERIRNEIKLLIAADQNNKLLQTGTVNIQHPT